MRILALAVIISAPLISQSPHRLYLEERHKGLRDVKLELTREILKRCSSSVVITQEKSNADFRLGIMPRASTLYRSDGDVAHVFSAKWTVSGLSKEVCSYLAQPRP
jgi:hypothetical protein